MFLYGRKKYTSSLGRAWAAADPGVVFVENPHSRLVLDPNRSPPADVMPGLREFFVRLQRQRAGEKIPFGGIDAVFKARKPGTALRVISLHDIMNTKMRADGAIVVERPAADRLPQLVNNRARLCGNFC